VCAPFSINFDELCNPRVIGIVSLNYRVDILLLALPTTPPPPTTTIKLEIAYRTKCTLYSTVYYTIYSYNLSHIKRLVLACILKVALVEHFVLTVGLVLVTDGGGG
jgi:hypothetical protein